MSRDLEWLLIRKYNSNVVKRLPEGPLFSKEAANLLNIHSHKYSGLANSKTISIQQDKGVIQVTTRKPGASLHAVNSGVANSTLRNRTGSRRALGATSKLFKSGYRPDLRRAAVSRTSALLASQKEKKARPARKPRGKKAIAAAAA